MNPVLLINPSSRRSIYQGLADEFAAIEPPLWCRLLSSYLTAKGIPTAIADTQFADSVEHAARWYMEAVDPSLAVVVVYGQQPSASTQTMPAAIAMCEALAQVNERGVPIVVVGTHPAALPERTLEETNADFVCTGEGFEALRQLYAYVRERREHWKYTVRPDFPQGVCYWEHGEAMRTNPAPLVWDTAEIPGREWSKLSGMRKRQYRAHNWHVFGQPKATRQNYASIYTTLGCPYSCSFCCIQAPFREGDEAKFRGKANSYRMWDAKQIADDVVNLVERWDVRHIKVADEMFLLNRAHVDSLCDELWERGISDHYVNIWFYSRVDTVGTDERLLRKMRRTGFTWAALGIESVYAEALGAVDKRDYSRKEVVAAVRRLQGEGISVIGNYIFGLPGDTLKTMGETLSFAQELNTEFVNMYCNVAFPGSRQYDELRAKGWRPPDWSAYSFHAANHTPLATEHMSAAEVLAFRDSAFQTYMQGAGYQRLISDKFGADALAEVRRMLEVPLKRELLDEIRGEQK
jgi:radical SAM superfamily enzyme YgiQ (UPF0313 family)